MPAFISFRGKMGDEQQEGHYWKDSLKREGLSQMMFGYGDDPLPLEESMDLVEELVHQFLTDLVHTLTLT